MKENVGGKDRALRVFLGTGALAVALFSPIPRRWKAAAFTFGASELFTAAFRYCPANDALGVDSRPRRGPIENLLRLMRG